MERMLGSNYDKMRDKTNKIREKNTELFMNMIFLMNFFNINLPLKDILQRLEHDLLMYEDGMTKETFLTVVNLHSRQKATTV
jgi:hypothetical protein